MDKWQGIRRTTLNIDSRNRRKVTYYDRLDMTIRRYNEFAQPEFNRPFLFEGNSNTVYLLLETQFTTSIENQQFIILSAPESTFLTIGSEDSNFIFDTLNAGPIFFVDKFIYDPLVDSTDTTSVDGRISNTVSSYLDEHIVTKPEVDNVNITTKKYKYNVIRFQIQTSIDSSLIKRGYIGDLSVKVSFISNMRQAFPNTSHYMMNLGKTFTNIYSVRLVSTEIPNTAYTFNNNVINSDFGRLKLKTEVNNKLRWIYKNDKITQPNYHVIAGSLFNDFTDANGITITDTLSVQQEDHFNYIAGLYQLTNLSNPTFERSSSVFDTFQRRLSVHQIQNAYTVNDDNRVIKKNNYFDTRYLFELTDRSVSDSSIRNLGFNLPNTIFTTHELIHSYFQSIYKSFLFFHGRYNTEETTFNATTLNVSYNYIDGLSNVNIPPTNRTVFFFNPSSHRVVISIHMDNADSTYTDYIKNSILPLIYPEGTESSTVFHNYPLRIQFHSLTNTDMTKMTAYTVDVVKIKYEGQYRYASGFSTTSSAYRVHYSFQYIPVSGMYDTIGQLVYSLNERLIMTIWNPLSNDVQMELQKRNPFIYSQLQRYSLMTRCESYPLYYYTRNTAIPDSVQGYELLSYKPFYADADSPFICNVSKEMTFIFNSRLEIPLTFRTYTTGAKPVKGQFMVDVSTKTILLSIEDVPSNFMEVVESNPYIVISNHYFVIDTRNSFRSFVNNNGDRIIHIVYTHSSYSNGMTRTDVFKSFTNGSALTIKLQSPKWENLRQIIFGYNTDNIDGSASSTHFTTEQLFGQFRRDIGILRMTKYNDATVTAEYHKYMELFISSYQLLDASSGIVYADSDVMNVSVNSFASNISNSYLLMNVRIKDNRDFFEHQTHEFSGLIDSTMKCNVYVFQEIQRVYLRNSIQSYISIVTTNVDTIDGGFAVNVYNGFNFQNSSQKYVYDTNVNSIPYMFDMAQYNQLRLNDFTDMLDLTKYDIIGLSKIAYNTGLTNTQFASEYIEESSKPSMVIYPSVDENSTRHFLPYTLSETTDNASISDLKEYTRYPVYQLDIEPSKYTEESLTQYITRNMGRVKRKTYDYQQEIFTNDSVVHTQSSILYESDSQSECKTVVSIKRASNSIQFKQYRKVFDAYTYSSLSSRTPRRVFANQGFPYIHFHIPEVSLANGSLIYIEGLPAIDSIMPSSLNTEHTVILPRNYRVKMRQLLPLPVNITQINTRENLFKTDKGAYIDNAWNDLYNMYVNYVNQSVNNDSVRDPTVEFIIENILGLNESGYIHHTSDAIQAYRQSSYTYESDTFLPPNNESQLYRKDLRMSYMNIHGTNTRYANSLTYNGNTITNATRNRYGLEYISSAWVNTARNGNTLWNEYRNTDDLTATPAFRTSLLHGECFVRLSDMHRSDTHMNIGRITHMTNTPDMNGNFDIQFDLFTDNAGQFSMFDIVIGLDSQTIAILVPYDYEYSQMPSVDMILMGLGAYLLHRYSRVPNHIAGIIQSVDDLIESRGRLSKQFIRSANQWTIQENRTHIGFYIKTDTVPTTSILTGVVSPQLRVYVPEFFRFIDDTDTPLRLFGFENTTYNNQFNYFKDNYTPFQSALINRSYSTHFQKKEAFIVFEAKEVNNYEVNDMIYIEDHRIIQKDIMVFKERYAGVKRLEPMSSYLTRLETIYNAQVLNYNGVSRRTIAQKKSPSTYQTDYFVDTVSTFTSHRTARMGIPYRNRIIAHHFHEDADNISVNYSLYYKVAPVTVLLSRADANTSQVFDVSYSITDGLSVFINNQDILSSFKAQSCAYHCNLIPTEILDDLYERTRQTITFYKDERSNRFVSSTVYDELPIKQTVSYTIRVHLFRRPIMCNQIDISANGAMQVRSYEPIGILERIMTNWMTHMTDYYAHDVAKAYYFDQRYNPHLYRNRILKFRVCPIDTLGFSYEPAVTSGALYTSSTSGPSRLCKSRSRRLFPYIEYHTAETYDRTDDGEEIVPTSYVYRTFGRPQQEKTNTQVDSRVFLPGMGVYAIQETLDSSANGTGRLPAYAYTYRSTFVGYVLNTSIRYDKETMEYARQYVIEDESFSAVDASNATWSEYEIYILMDEQIQTRDDVNTLFDKLNKDYTHIVYDAGAKESERIVIDGIMQQSRKPYSYNYTYDASANTVTLSSLTSSTIPSSEYAYLIPENRYGHCALWDMNTSSIVYTETDRRDTSNQQIATNNVDGLLNLTASNLVINRPQLNRTLTGYSFQTRLACATLVQRPVLYTDEGQSGDVSGNSRLFITGEYDLFYKEFVESKTVAHYDPVYDKDTLDYLNTHQYPLDNPRSNNFRSKNTKEYDAHAGYLDDTRQNSFEFADATTYTDNDRIATAELKSRISFESGDDMVFIRATKETDGIPSTEIVKVFTGALLPCIFLDDTRYIQSKWNQQFINTCILDMDYYDKSLESFHKVPCLLKARGYNLDIVGNMSEDFEQRTDIDKYDYNFMYATGYTERTDLSGSVLSVYPYQEYANRATSPFTYNDLMEGYRLYQLKGCMVITYPFINTFEGSYPYNSLDFSEIGIIELASTNTVTNHVDCILENRLYETYNITNPNDTFQPLISIPYKTYTTCITSVYDRMYSRNASNIGNTSISHCMNLPNKSVIAIEMASNMDFETGTNIDEYLIYNDVFMNDNTLEHKTMLLIDYGVERPVVYKDDGTIPFTIEYNSNTDIEQQLPMRKTTAFARLERPSMSQYHPRMTDVFVDSIVSIFSLDELVPSMGNIVIRQGYGVYRQYPDSDGNIQYKRYPDAEGIGRNYAIATTDVEKEHYICYGTYVSLVDTDGETTYPRYKYANVTHVENVAIDMIFNTFNLPTVTPDMSGMFILVNNIVPELYRCINDAWILQSNIGYAGQTFTIDASSSFYNGNVYVYDEEMNKFIPVYQSEIYHDPVFYSQFVYDKVDFEVITADTTVIDAGYFPRHSKVMVRTYASDFSIETSARFYEVNGIIGRDASSNYFKEYTDTVPDGVTIRSNYAGYSDVSGAGGRYIGGELTYIVAHKKFIYKTTGLFQIEPTVMSSYHPSFRIQDIIQNEPLQYQGKNPSQKDVYRLIAPATLYTSDISGGAGTEVFYLTEDGTPNSLFYKYTVGTSRILVENNAPDISSSGFDTQFTFSVSSHLFGRSHIIYVASQLPERSLQVVYPEHAELAVFDILTAKQLSEIQDECARYPNLVGDGELVVTYDCNVYQYRRSQSQFVAYNNNLIVGKRIYVYGTFTGNRGKLFQRISNIVPLISTSQVYADYHVADLLQISNDSVYLTEIADRVAKKQIQPYELLLVYRATQSEQRYSVYRVDGSGIAQPVSIDGSLQGSSNTSVFPIVGRTFFINGANSDMRGCMYRFHSSRELHQVVIGTTDIVLPVYYPENTRVISMTNPLRDRSSATDLYSNNLTTQPFLSGNQWYTKVFYKGSLRNLVPYMDIDGTEHPIFSNITSDHYSNGGERCFETTESHRLFFSGMKGLRIPFINISPRHSTSANNTGSLTGSFYYGKVADYSIPVPSDYLTISDPISEDYSAYLSNGRTIRKIQGRFEKGRTEWDYTDMDYRFRLTDEEYEYPYIIIPGFHLGYGGRIQERQDEEYVNSIINNDNGLRVSRISQLGGKQYIYTELPVQHSEYFEKNWDDVPSKMNIRGRNRRYALPYDMQFEYVDKLFKNPDYLDGMVTIFGTGGRIVKKRINNPYQLNQNNYVFLVIPDLNHIDNTQNTLFSGNDGAFAKILLPGDSNRVVYKSHVGSTKVYYDMLFNNLSELEIAFVTNKGTLFDFNGAEHSFTLEITELIDKMEYVDAQTGNIRH
jgi:hypothetical protein